MTSLKLSSCHLRTSMGIPRGIQPLWGVRWTTITSRIHLGGSYRRMLAWWIPKVWVCDLIWETRQICSVLADTWLWQGHRLFPRLMLRITLIWHLEHAYLSLWLHILRILYQQIGLKFEEETCEMLRLEHGSVWCWNLDAPGNRSETPGKIWNVVLEKDGEDQLDRSCEKWRSVT